MAETLKAGAKLTKAGDVNLATKVGRGFKEILENMDINYRAAEKSAKTDELNWKRYGDQLTKEEVLTRQITREAEEAQAVREQIVNDADNQLQIDQLEGINNDIELEAYRNIQEDEERKKDEKRAEQVEKAQKKMAGESGFRGLIKVSREGFKNLFTSQKDMAEHFDDLRGEFASDMDFLSSAMAPLMALPGVNAAMKTIKFIFIALWKGLQWMWARRKARDAKADTEKRTASLIGGDDGDDRSLAEIDEDKKGGFLRFFIRAISKMVGFILGIIVGMGAMIGAFFGRITAPFRTGGKIFKLFGSPAWITKVGVWFSNIFGKTGKIATFFGKIKAMIPAKLIKAMSAIGRVSGVSAGASTFTRIVTFMRTIGGTLGKFFWPITVLMSAWEAIKGFIDGFGDTEGGFLEKIVGGLYGAMGSLVDFLIMWPLDLVKDVLAWIGEKMGFDTTAMKEFSFSDMWADIWGRFTDGMLKIVRFFVALGKGSLAAIGALKPFGESPREAFNRVFEEEMSKPAGLKSQGGTSAASTFKGVKDSIKDYGEGDAVIAANREIELAGAGAGGGANNNIALDKSITINKKGDTIYLEDTEPKDGFGSRISGWWSGE